MTRIRTKIKKLLLHALQLSLKVGAFISNKLNKFEYYRIMKRYMIARTPDEAGFSSHLEGSLRTAIRGPIKFAMVTIGIGVGFFIIWGGLAPLDSAAIAEGTIIVAGHHKAVQHLEGGIIDGIFVHEGQLVSEGDVLIKLNDTNAKAQIQIITTQLNFANAIKARLNAEQNDYEKIIWSDAEFDQRDQQIRTTIETQDKLFHNRREELTSNLGIINERIKQSEEQITGLEVKQKSVESQIVLINEELKSTEDLFKKGLALRPKLLELKRYHDDLIANLAEVKARISSLKQTIAENKLQIINVRNQYYKEVARELKENHSQILELTEKYNATLDVVSRTEIVAPASGIVTDMQYHTVGGVINPGQRIMDIVPQSEKLIVEARIKTQDIDSIYPGLIAKVQLGAYKSRLVPRLEGKVIYVAADKLTDQQTGMPYYLARIEIDEMQLAKLNMAVKLYPGMPVSVFVVKGTRTFLEYLISPIKDSFFRAFKET